MMVAQELAARYVKGESKSALAREFHMSWDKVASILVHMDAHGPRCKRCQILLSQAPRGDAGICGWCKEGT
jgi:hypothetical protein